MLGIAIRVNGGHLYLYRGQEGEHLFYFFLVEAGYKASIQGSAQRRRLHRSSLLS